MRGTFEIWLAENDGFLISGVSQIQGSQMTWKIFEWWVHFHGVIRHQMPQKV